MTQEQWDALKPGDRLRRVDDTDVVEVIEPTRFYHIKGDGCGPYTYASMPDKWELVKPQMNWYDAMKAVREGLTVRSASMNGRYVWLDSCAGMRSNYGGRVSWEVAVVYQPPQADMDATDWEVVE
jgi:hypothetical protein